MHHEAFNDITCFENLSKGLSKYLLKYLLDPSALVAHVLNQQNLYAFLMTMIYFRLVGWLLHNVHINILISIIDEFGALS